MATGCSGETSVEEISIYLSSSSVLTNLIAAPDKT
jgi:hypothetical protein